MPTKKRKGPKAEEPVHMRDGPTQAKAAGEVMKSESQTKKIMVRTLAGGMIVILFNVIIWAGHSYTVLWVLLLQFGCFREMVRLGYKPGIERPLLHFRELQWFWFCCACFQVYGQWLSTAVHELNHSFPSCVLALLRYQPILAMIMYSIAFVVSVLSLTEGKYLYQIQQLTFTMVSLLLIFGQMQGTMQVVYRGLIWYFVPASLVVTNDIMAYFAGMAVGRRVFNFPLLKLSPNKTWEGFLGAIFFTIVFAFVFTGYVANFKWMICPAERLTLDLHSPIMCDPSPLFTRQPLVEVIGIDIPALSTVTLLPVQLHMCFIALFISLVGPFGGFVASGIKRAFDVKDFASIIPGHGGIMDRMDCQMLAGMFVSVYLSQFA